MLKDNRTDSQKLSGRIFVFRRDKNDLPQPWTKVAKWKNIQNELANKLLKEYDYTYVLKVIKWAINNGWYKKFKSLSNVYEMIKEYENNEAAKTL